jgi:hypothetical protein
MKIINSISTIKILFIGILLSQSSIGFCQENKNSDLYKAIMSRDSLLFNIGFNTCDLSQSENLFSDQLEFYHDKGGLSNKSESLKALKNGLCNSPTTYQSRRELVNGSTQVFPLYKDGILYGAIQNGIHQFYETNAEKGKPLLKENEKLVGKARFTHVWILENNNWKLKRILSYDHLPSNEDLN